MSEKYKDFEETNVVWTWDDNNEFTKYHINHMITGDTDSAYLAIPEKLAASINHDIDEIVTISDTVGTLTNEAFPDFCKMAFNCPAEREDVIKTDRETVFNKGFFLTKKRYIINVVDDEGKRQDKLKIVGVEIKKSNTSDAVKEMLMNLVNLILAGEDEESVKNEIKKMKKHYPEYDLKQIATPMGCKTLKSAQEQFEAVGNLTGIHYAARAAMFYNSQCGEYDKQVNPGEKIGLFYIRHPKSKYIGYPLDASNLPDWLYEVQIDYDMMWKKAYNTITNYLEALEWDVKSKKKKTKEKLFGF